MYHLSLYFPHNRSHLFIINYNIKFTQDCTNHLSYSSWLANIVSWRSLTWLTGFLLRIVLDTIYKIWRGIIVLLPLHWHPPLCFKSILTAPILCFMSIVAAPGCISFLFILKKYIYLTKKWQHQIQYFLKSIK